MIVEGIVKSFDPNTQYGFLGAPGIAGDIYAHGLAVVGRHRLRPGQVVQFELEQHAKGPRAQRIRIVRKARKS